MIGRGQMELEYFVVDVFTAAPAAGNPLAGNFLFSGGRFGKGERSALGRKHRCCSNRTVFPVAMHMLSTGFHLRK